MRLVRVSIALALVGVAACSVYDTSLLVGAKDASLGGASGAGGSNPGGGGSSGTGASGGSAGQTTGCKSAVPPDPPAQSGLGGTIEFVVAMHTVDFGDRDYDGGTPNYQLIGYDLDTKCTCFEGATNSCLTPSWATASNCDGPGGRDNASGALIYDIRKNYFSNFGSDTWNQDIAKGSWTMMLRVRAYNGTPDDDQIDLIWYMPDNLNKVTGEPPKWDGTDAWPIQTECLVPEPVDAGTGDADPDGAPQYEYDLDKPRFIDPKGYVSGGVLVATVPNSVITLSESVTVRLTAAFVTATIVSDNGKWRLENGVIAARWRASDILGQLPQFKDPLTQKPMCTDSLLYPKFKEKTCSYVDIYSSVATPNTPCDSLSVGVAFTADPAALGSIVKLAPVPPACSPALDPANDTCESLTDAGP